VLEVNVLGQFYFAHAAIPGMVERGRGRVVNVSSAAAGFASPGYSGYCASKAALTLWTECLAGSAAPYGVSVMAYQPGFVRTDMTEYSAARPDTEVGNPIVEYIREGFAAGTYDAMEDAVERLLQVAAGVYDSLPGRQIGVNDLPEVLLPKAAEIEERGLYVVRVNELAK
jgi:NAD(P)-dependent dehydrogenase (short-subunit alcohol dehydrogenase family)